MDICTDNSSLIMFEFLCVSSSILAMSFASVDKSQLAKGLCFVIGL